MDEALKYGFRRVTPMDDCSDQFQGTFKTFPNTLDQCFSIKDT